METERKQRATPNLDELRRRIDRMQVEKLYRDVITRFGYSYADHVRQMNARRNGATREA